MKLIIPLVLALAAGFLNYLALSKRTVVPEMTFLQATADLDAGALFTDASTEPLKISVPEEQLEALKAAAVPASEKSVLVGNPAPRPLKKGDLILWRDTLSPPQDLTAGPGEKVLPVSLEGLTVEPGLLKVGRNVGFLVARGAGGPGGEGPESELEYVGPFRLLSIGTTLNADAFTYTRPDTNGQGNRRIVSVAVRLIEGNRLDPKSRLLVTALTADRDPRRRLLAILLDPAAGSNATEPSTKEGGSVAAVPTP